MTTFKQLFMVTLLLAICLFVSSDAMPMPMPIPGSAIANGGPGVVGGSGSMTGVTGTGGSAVATCFNSGPGGWPA
ncbi:9626_t:CDS:2 [Ambispora gerdemannii]|uniref:9626_t:CDS:1 n=1 Tax=Ambispora gerdemannii TaxID=144530 RepID=A0A9N9D6U0_9GLOM|nr:9626_t:CDS:2 [Ambispora gerdemannii]